MLDEFSIIRTFFTRQNARADVIASIGDDAAVLQVPQDQQLVVTMDTLVAGVHFLATVDPIDLGHKVLAVNLSDLAAMGATPAWATLALTLPAVDETWLRGFTQGFFALAQHFQVQLVGGDLTRGPLTITCQMHGFVPKGQALHRNQAQVGDWIGVTGPLGDAGLALALLQQRLSANESVVQAVLPKLLRPWPRIEQGQRLRQVAHSAIDISDGLLADLGHILEQSGVGARVQVEDIPLSAALSTALDPASAWQLALSAGDDYELCFTIAPENWPKLVAAAPDCAFYAVGVIEKELGLRCEMKNGESFATIQSAGYRHF